MSVEIEIVIQFLYQQEDKTLKSECEARLRGERASAFSCHRLEDASQESR